MKIKMQVVVAAALIAVIGAFGVIESLQAAPNESQRLRGMEGRVFINDSFILDEDGNIVGPNESGNCYRFYSAAEWVDDAFPVPGTWEQHSVGAATSYTATADWFLDPSDQLPFIALIQRGDVTPANGRGVLQLRSITEVYFFGEFLFEILTIGHEDPDCVFVPGG